MYSGIASMIAAGAIVVSASVGVCALDQFPDDLGAWTDKGKVLGNGSGGSWDSDGRRGMFLVDVLKVDGTYYLYYIGGVSSCWGDGPGHSCLGLATSTDGKNFTKHSKNPVLKPEQDVFVCPFPARTRQRSHRTT